MQIKKLKKINMIRKSYTVHEADCISSDWSHSFRIITLSTPNPSFEFNFNSCRSNATPALLEAQMEYYPL
jgi:hypothetical protein